MKFEINITLETKTEGRFDDILTEIGMLLLKNKTNVADCTLGFKRIEDGSEFEEYYQSKGSKEMERKFSFKWNISKKNKHIIKYKDLEVMV